MRDLSSQLGIEPRAPALGAQSLNHWTTREVPHGMLFFFFFYLIYFWLCQVFVAARGLSLVVVSRGYSSLRCACFSLWWFLLLRSSGARRTGFSCCGAWA